MWFENAMGKEKIKFMFDNELCTQDIEIYNFSLERFSDLKFRFFLKNIPKKHPDKWRKEGFNAISMEIIFGDVIQLDITGSRVGFSCSPEIISLKDYSEIKIEHESLSLYCKSKFLTIDAITPYIDERWD